MKISIQKIGNHELIKSVPDMGFAKVRHCKCGGMLVWNDSRKGFDCNAGCNGNWKQTDWVDNIEKDLINKKRSCMRSKKKVIEIAECLDVDRMLTLTFADCVKDIDVALSALKEFMRLMRLSNEELSYICVPELQKRGAIHFHLGVGRFVFWRVIWINWQLACKRRTGNKGGIYINRAASRSNGGVSRYISKYIVKDLDGWLGKGRKRYYTNAYCGAKSVVKIDYLAFVRCFSGWGYCRADFDAVDYYPNSERCFKYVPRVFRELGIEERVKSLFDAIGRKTKQNVKLTTYSGFFMNRNVQLLTVIA